MRVKHVMKPSMVAHVWAAQSQDSARVAHGSFYFEGPTIYSWGSHFPIAMFVTNKKGQRAVLWNDRTYSSSTSAHQYEVRQALHGLNLPEFPVPNLCGMAWGDSDTKVLESYLASAAASLKAFDAPRIRPNTRLSHYRAALHDYGRFEAYAKFFGIRRKAPKLPAKVLAKLADVEAKGALQDRAKALQDAAREVRRAADYAAWQAREPERAAERARYEAKRKEEDRVRLEEKDQRRAAWIAGEEVELYGNEFERGEPTLLRVFGDNVETSRGAEVPVDHSKRLWPIIQRIMKSGTPYVRNGHTEHVGHFTVDRIDPTGDMQIGCHSIPFAETAKIAVVLGLV